MQNDYPKGYKLIAMPYHDWLGLAEHSTFELVDHPAIDKKVLPYLSREGAIPLIPVVTVVSNGGTCLKIDGRPIKALWPTVDGAPELVYVRVVELQRESLEALGGLAENLHQDSLSHSDLIKLAYRAQGIDPVSDRLRHGQLYEAFHIALRGKPRPFQDKRELREQQDIDMAKAVAAFREELIELDRLNLNKEIFVTGVLAGCLVMLGVGMDVLGFLSLLNTQRGETKDQAKDPVASLLYAIHGASFRSTKKVAMNKTGVELCKKTIQAGLSFLAGPSSRKYWRKVEMTGVDHTEMIRQLKLKKKIMHEMEL